MEFLWKMLDNLLLGGWVMVPLAVLCLVMWILIIDRLLLYRDLLRPDLSLDEAREAVGGRADAAAGGLRGRLVELFRSGVPHRGLGAAAWLHSCSKELQDRYERRISLIEILAAIAPLLGLLGTVLGMIETFDVISVFGTGNPRAMASGISVALITTQTGLLVAIPGLFFANRLRRLATEVRMRLQETVVVLERDFIDVKGERA